MVRSHARRQGAGSPPRRSRLSCVDPQWPFAFNWRETPRPVALLRGDQARAFTTAQAAAASIQSDCGSRPP